MVWSRFSFGRLVQLKSAQKHKKRLATKTTTADGGQDVLAQVTTTVKRVVQKGTGSNARVVIKAEGRDLHGDRMKGKVDLRGIHIVKGMPRVIEIWSPIRVVHARRHANKKLRGGTCILVPQ